VASSNFAQPSASTAGSVLWACAAEPPPGMASYLRSEGLALRVHEPPSSWPAPRLVSLHTRLPGKLRLLSFSGQRIAVLHSDPAQATALAMALRARSAEVFVMNASADEFLRLEHFDPDAVLVDIADFYGSCWHVISALWQHGRLRWTPVVLTPPALASQGVPVRELHLLNLTLQELTHKREELISLVGREEPFDFPVNVLGPARTLNALRATGRSLCVSFTSRRVRLEIDLADHEVIGLRGGSLGRTDRTLGSDALDWLYRREQGKVRVYPADEHLPRISSVREIAAPPELRELDDRRTVPFRASTLGDAGEPPTVVRLPARELAKAIEIVRAQIPAPHARQVPTLRIDPSPARRLARSPRKAGVAAAVLLAAAFVAADAFSFTLDGLWARAWSWLLSL
jgi:hypothetical protein